jgi:hypothetical protein
MYSIKIQISNYFHPKKNKHTDDLLPSLVHIQSLSKTAKIGTPGKCRETLFVSSNNEERNTSRFLIKIDGYVHLKSYKMVEKQRHKINLK